MTIEVGYGHGGWVRVRDETLPGPLYLRYRSDRGRPVLTELYLDGEDHELATSVFRNLNLAAITAAVMSGKGAWLDRTTGEPGPDLSTLATHYASTFTPLAEHWVAESWRAQLGQAPAAPRASHGASSPTEEPRPVSPPTQGLTDDFLHTVAENYAWAGATGQRPAVMIADQTGHSVRTVHAWIRKARDRGILPPTRRGRMS